MEECLLTLLTYPYMALRLVAPAMNSSKINYFVCALARLGDAYCS